MSVVKIAGIVLIAAGILGLIYGGFTYTSENVGESATHRRDEDLTKMRQLVLDAKEGRMAWAALAPGGFLGMAREVKSWT